jgi:hypothetical protein
MYEQTALQNIFLLISMNKCAKIVSHETSTRDTHRTVICVDTAAQLSAVSMNRQCIVALIDVHGARTVTSERARN